MLEKLKQSFIHLNLKKAVIIFSVAGIVLVSVSSVAVYSSLSDKNIKWQNIVVLDREKETDYEQENELDLKGERQDKEGDREKQEYKFDVEEKELYLSATDIALMIGCGIIGIVLGVWYWLLCLIWAYQKSYQMGINSALWVLAALFFHIGAIVVLYLYAMAKGTCENCGRLKTNHGKFCDRCGNSLKKECSQCGQVVDVEAGYCNNCGKKLHKREQ